MIAASNHVAADTDIDYVDRNDNNGIERSVQAESRLGASQQDDHHNTGTARNAVAVCNTTGRHYSPQINTTGRHHSLQVNEIEATAVDLDEENCKMQERIDKEIEEELARQVAESDATTEVVAEVVTGFWCSRREKIIGALRLMLVILAVVMGIVFGPRALEPADPTPSPTAAPTSQLFALTELLSNASPDGGKALARALAPQNEALNWLVDNKNLELYSEEQKYNDTSLRLSTTAQTAPVGMTVLVG